MKIRIAILCAALLAGAVFAPRARAQAVEDVAPETVGGEAQAIETAEGRLPEGGGMPPVLEPPRFARFKHPQPDFLLQTKREGRYFTPMPIVGWDPDVGFSLGAMANFFDNGKKTDPLFRYTPYRQQIMAAAMVTTRKLIQVSAYYDQPYLFDSPWRVRGEVEFLRNPVQNYFGIGSGADQLVSPWDGQVFGSYSNYKNNLGQVIGGQTYGKYDEYRLGRVMFQGSAEYDLAGGLIRPLVGLRVARVWIHDYTGSGSGGAVELPTHLRVDCASGRAVGCDGGFDLVGSGGRWDCCGT